MTMGALSGLETLEHVRAGGVTVGIADLLGREMAELEAGRVVFAITTGSRLANPLGTLHGGIAATLLDSALGCAVHSMLTPGTSYTTVDLAVKFLRAGPLDGSELRAEGRIVHLGRRTATAEGELRGADGRVLASGTTTCLILPGPDAGA